MNLKRIFNPWSEIARLEDELIDSANATNYWHRRFVATRVKTEALEREIADLKARAVFRDPKTGRLVKRGQG